MARFDIAVDRLLKFEGGFSDHPNDHGGATAFGISLRWYMNTVDPSATVTTIKNLSRERAVELYAQHFWRYGLIVDQALANKFLDMSVNMGSGTAHGIIQKAVNYVSGALLNVDGVFGPKSIMAVNACDPDALLGELRARAVERYALIVLNDPSQKAFLLGWCRRAVA